MAKGAKYRVPFRRRAEGKTNYHLRLKLLKSKKLRIVIRSSQNHISVQVIKSTLGGDKVLVNAHSKELSKKYGWKAFTGNLPAAYLTGYLAGLRAKKQEIEESVLDLGLFRHRQRVLAAFMGFLKSGIEVPHSEEFFPENLEERVKGAHIEAYANLLKQNQPEKYEQMFSGYINKNKINPLKISQEINSTIKKIESNA